MLWTDNVDFTILPRAHAQGVKESVCPSVVVVVVVVVGTKITRSQVLGVCAFCKHNQSVDIGEKVVCSYTLQISQKGLLVNRAFSVQYACGLSTTPTFFSIIVCGCDCACSSTMLERVITS